jgi:hypothetical protein
MSHQMMPPADGLHPSITVNGRGYTCALGATISVPDHDAAVMMANGWVSTSPGGAGATAVRPNKPSKSLQFFDSDLGYIIIWDGKFWRNSSGVAV